MHIIAAITLAYIILVVGAYPSGLSHHVCSPVAIVCDIYVSTVVSVHKEWLVTLHFHGPCHVECPC